MIIKRNKSNETNSSVSKSGLFRRFSCTFLATCQIASVRRPEFCIGKRRELIILPKGALGHCLSGRTNLYLSSAEIGKR